MKRTSTDGIWKWSQGERPLLGSEETLRKILYETYGPKNTKRKAQDFQQDFI
jgi:hypothetical protein